MAIPMVSELPTLSPTTGSLVDWAFGLGVGLSVVVGVFRGLIKEMLSLIGWAVAYFSAQWWGVPVGALLPVGVPGSQINALAGMVVVFLAAWLAWAAVTWALREVVAATGLGGADRLLGGVFGLLRGLLLALVVYTLVGMTPLAQWGPWQSAKALPWLQTLLTGLRPVLPERILEFLPVQTPADPAEGCGSLPCEKEVI